MAKMRNKRGLYHRSMPVYMIKLAIENTVFNAVPVI